MSSSLCPIFLTAASINFPNVKIEHSRRPSPDRCYLFDLIYSTALVAGQRSFPIDRQLPLLSFQWDSCFSQQKSEKFRIFPLFKNNYLLVIWFPMLLRQRNNTFVEHSWLFWSKIEWTMIPVHLHVAKLMLFSELCLNTPLFWTWYTSCSLFQVKRS